MKKGFTLVEVLLGILILAMVSFGLMSVILASRKTQSSSDRRQLSSLFATQLREALRNYDIADDRATKGATGNFLTLKNTTGGYALTGDVCASCAGVGGVVWAFDAGTHNVTNSGLLPSWFTAAPFSGTLTYTVTAVGSAPNISRSVSVNVNWTEPKP